MPSSHTEVFVRTRFAALHCWPAAPDAVAFLRAPHRHEFHVTAYTAVRHDDRDIEFLLLKQALDATIADVLATEDTLHWSCEAWARRLAAAHGLTRCEVSEDGENGAVFHAG